jgi:hypothetical protein
MYNKCLLLSYAQCSCCNKRSSCELYQKNKSKLMEGIPAYELKVMHPELSFQ